MEWKKPTFLSVDGNMARPGAFHGKDGIITNITPNFIKNLFRHFNDALPFYLTHDNRDVVGFLTGLGYNDETDTISYNGIIFDSTNRNLIEKEGFDSISPEIVVTDGDSDNPLDGFLTGAAFTINPAIPGTKANHNVISFSAYEGDGVIPPHKFSYKENSSSSWSRPTLSDFTDKSFEELSAQEIGVIAGHFAWAAEYPPKSFSDLKFPHHDPKTHDVVWGGVVAAMAAVNGARTPASISDADKSAVYSHLAKHYKEFDKEVPKKMFELGEAMVTENPIKQPEEGVKLPQSAVSQAEVELAKRQLDDTLTSYKSQIETLSADLNTYKTKAETLETSFTSYKEKYETLLKSEVAKAENDLIELGIEKPTEFAANLDPESRLEVLKSAKVHLVKTGKISKPIDQKIEAKPPENDRKTRAKAMGIPDEYLSYIH